MRQFYTLPALKKVLRLNKNKESIKMYFGLFVTFAWHTLLKLSHNINTIIVFDTLQKKYHTLSLPLCRCYPEG